MSTYTIWDLPSNTLLVETRQLDTVVEVTETYVSDNGESALSDLLLGIEPEDSSLAHDFSGLEILRAIRQEQATYRTR